MKHEKSLPAHIYSRKRMRTMGKNKKMKRKLAQFGYSHKKADKGLLKLKNSMGELQSLLSHVEISKKNK